MEPQTTAMALGLGFRVYSGGIVCLKALAKTTVLADLPEKSNSLTSRPIA